MTSRERLLRAISGKPTDRVPVKLWGVDPFATPDEPTYRPLYELARSCDQMIDWHPSTGVPFALNAHPDIHITTRERPSKHAGYVEIVTQVSCRQDTLESVYLKSVDGKPGLIGKHLITDTEEAKAFLRLPWERFEPEAASFAERDRRIGDEALLYAGLPADPIYQLQILVGSETLAIWSVIERPLVQEFLRVFQHRWHGYVESLLKRGVGPVFGYVGPELCIPPLMSYRDFDEFVVEIEKPTLDAIHEAGGLVWVHCHGNMRNLLARFHEMGVDCLNPIEPPPMGDITLSDAKKLVGDRMTLEGNIEVGYFQELAHEEFRQVCVDSMHAGKPDGRFIFCPTSDHSHWPQLSNHIMDNYRTFVEVGKTLGQY